MNKRRWKPGKEADKEMNEGDEDEEKMVKDREQMGGKK